MQKTKRRKRNIPKYVIVILLMCSIVLGITQTKNITSYIKNFFAAGDVPAHTKDIDNNHDGTHKLSLDITGEADTTSEIPNVNVMVVFDISNSMKSYPSGDPTYYEVDNTGPYGKVGDEYVQLYRRSGNNWNASYNEISYSNTTTYNTVYYKESNGTYTQYTGKRYKTATRADSAEKTIYDFTNSLFTFQNSAHPENIQMSFITFSHGATILENWTSNKTTITNHLSDTGAANSSKIVNSSGTNYEVALKKALELLNSDATDKDPTYVIFITDGAPSQVEGTSDGTYLNAADCYEAAQTPARNIHIYDTNTHTSNEETSNTTLYGIYAFGDEADYLDDVIYYALNGEKRAEEQPGTDTTENYFNAGDTTELNKAIEKIFKAIVKTAGLGTVTINDGTTHAVETTTGPIANLLEVDESSYEYWLSMPVVNNTITRKDLITGKDYEIHLEDIGNGKIKATSDKWGETGSVTVSGTITNGIFKYKWTEANNLNEYAPPQAKLKDGAVVWNLKSLETLLNGVTYTVTFDVYPSQDTYDLIADLKNGTKDYDTDVDANIRKYLHKVGDNYTLDTNTTGTITYTDTRITDTEDPRYGEQTSDYTNPPPVNTDAAKINVTKKWENELDNRPASGLTMNLKRDGQSIEEITLNDGNNWTDSKFISTGLLRTIKDKDTITGIQVLDKGHDYTLTEPDNLAYYWELDIETVHPMLIDGELYTLVEVKGLDIPSGISEKDYYKDSAGREFYRIDNKVFYAKYKGNTANLTATNNRKSNLNVKKVVTGDAIENEEFKFNFNIVNKKDKEVWFSVMDTNDNNKIVHNIKTNATKEDGDTGYYYMANGEDFYVYLQDGWNIRFINLGQDTDYTITEEEKSPFNLIGVHADTIITSVKELPVGAVSIGNNQYTYGATTYTKKEKDGNTYYEYKYTPNIEENVTTGKIVETNTSFNIEYNNDYPKTAIQVDKKWVKNKPATDTTVNVELYQNGVATGKKVELKEENNWKNVFKDLDINDSNGKPYNYTVKEDSVAGYKDYYEAKTDISVIAHNVPEDYEEEIEVTVLADGQQVGKVTLTKDNNWQKVLKDVSYFNENGSIKEITTAINMDNAEDNPVTVTHELTNKRITVTNIETISQTVKKVWNDANNQDGVRPTSLTVVLSNGEEVVLNAENSWEGTLNNLPKYDKEGKTIEYTWREKDLPSTYKLTNTGTEGTITTLTNTHTPEETEITIKKIWDDNNNQDGIRPTTLVVSLSNGEDFQLKSSENWEKTIEHLPKYANGQLIKYTWTETSVPTGYELTGNNTEGTLTTITNKHRPEETEATIKKVWSDSDNQDGIRPNEVVMTLSNGQTVTLNTENNWEATIEHLPKYANGQEIKYTWTETPVPAAYEVTKNTTEGTVTTITNTHKPAETEATVKKVWNDANDQDGKRPSEIIITLSDGQTVTLNTENNWEATIEHLPKFNNGQLINYTWTETNIPEGYEVTGNTKEGTITTITNTHKPEEIEATVMKVWNDANNQDGIRPDEIVISLSDGQVVVLDAENNWTATISNLPKYAKGQLIKYTWKETVVPEGYELTSNETEGTITTITNTHKTAETEATIKKVWDDANNQDGVRPSEIIMTLSDGKTATLNAANGWSETIKNLPKYEDGKEIEYTWSETTVPTGYELTEKTKEGTITTITNTHKPETTTVAGTKTWSDADNQDGLRPTEIIVNLLADNIKKTSQTVTVGSDGKWTYSFKDLPKYKDGQEIKYTVTEEKVNEYSPEISGYDIINTHSPFETEVSVTKTWDDSNNNDGKRPDKIDVVLKADGITSSTIELNESNKWSYTWTNLPRKKNGVEIVYTVEELVVPTGYSSKIEKKDSQITTPDNTSYTNHEVVSITNAHESEETEVTIKKVWDDANNQDGIRPDEITMTLSNGKTVTLKETNGWTETVEHLPKYKDGQEIKYTWSETNVPTGYAITGNVTDGKVTTITNTHKPEETEATIKKVWDDASNQDGIRPDEITVTLSNGQEVTLSASNNWTSTIKNLPKYKNGQEIKYTWSETNVPTGYEVTGNSAEGTVTTITNTHKPEETEATVMKVWDDASNQDGIRPDEITVTLSNGQEVTLSASNNWTSTIKNLPKYKDGQEIKYTWSETNVPTGYELTSNNTVGTLTTITNTHKPEETEATVKKVWDDASNQDGIRSEELVVTLSNGQEVTLSASNNWTSTVKNLPKYKNGQEIKYTWSETNVPTGYELTSNNTVGILTTITNTHKPEETEATVKKVWDDASNQDGIRPEELVVTLSNGQEVTLSATNNWTSTVKNLPKYKDGQEIKYTWSETNVPTGYEVTGNNTEGTITTITNTHKPEETETTVKKVWDDASNQDGIRPEELVVTLSNGQEVTLSATNNWTSTVKNLPKYKDGQEIKYTWSETSVPTGYELTSNNTVGILTTITNTHKPETTTVAGTKTWSDADNQDGLRPTEIIVNLLADNIKKTSQTVTVGSDGKWTYSFKDLPKYKDGQEIKYTVTEEKVNEYSPEISGYDIINTHSPFETEVSVTKTWDDSNNNDGKRPEKITVVLQADGITSSTTELNESNKWSYTWTNLPRKKNGQEIKYTIKELVVPSGYISTSEKIDADITTSDNTTYINSETISVVNTHKPEETEATIKKVWDDANNQDGIRPDEITVTLSNGQEVTLSAKNNWTSTVKNLPKYKDGQEIKYTWSETSVPAGYEITGNLTDGKVTTITNTHKPEETEATVKKVWDDASNQDGIRPEELVVNLSNGQEVTLSAKNNWTSTVKNLPKYSDGQEIKYTWSETNVPTGYEITGNVTDGKVTTITNTHKPEETEAIVMKVWEDASNQDGVRPDEITVTLSNGQEVTLSATNNWTSTIKNLPKYSDGQEIKYTWSETSVPTGYELTSNNTVGILTTITNTHKPEETEATIKKVWDDASNQDGIRPEKLVVTLSDGQEVTLNASNNWTTTIKNLPKYKDGQEIKYTWSEKVIPKDYQLSKTETEGTITTITNTHKPENVETTIKKIWDDADNQDGIRPNEITMALSDGQTVTLNESNNWTVTIKDLPKYKEGKEIKYTWTETTVPAAYEVTDTKVEGNTTTITNTHKPLETEATIKKVWDDASNQDGIRPDEIIVMLSDGQTVTLNKDNNWTTTIKNLPKYKEGKEIKYTWTENSIPTGYEVTGNNTERTITTITNTHKPEETEATIKKVWDDASNQDGIRPDEITVTLSNGQEVTLNTTNNWEATIKNLPKYKDGQEIKYTWSETNVPTGYEVTGNSAEGTITTITNTHEPATTEATIKKVWDDDDNQDGIRPNEIVVTLSNGQSVTLNAVTGWTDTIKNLPRYKDGKEIKYTWNEKSLPTGYELTGNSKEGTITTLTNTHKSETVIVSGTKTWNDLDNQDGLRPTEIIVNLLADNVKTATQTVTVGSDGKWTYSFKDLPKYKIVNGEGGQEIVYTITEEKVKEYNTSTNGYNIINTHSPFETEVSVTKTWDDTNDIDGKRPETINVVLKTDGIASSTIELNETNKWSYTWSNLPRKKNGKDITYTIEELVVPVGYTSESTKTDKETTTLDKTVYTNSETISITNTHTPEKTKVFGTKVWDDASNQDGLRPETITINLLKNGTVVAEKEISEKDNWEFTWENLDKYELDENGKGGKLIEYTVKEVMPESLKDSYTTTITGNIETGFTITNTHEPETTNLSGQKIWNDAQDQDGLRPESITINVLANNEFYTSTTIEGTNTEDTWNYSFTDLPVYKVGSIGEKVTYTVEEVVPSGYTRTIENNNIINTHIPETTRVSGTKIWDDANNQDGVRPQTITIKVLDNETVVDTIIVTGDKTADSWNYTSKDLPKYRNHGTEEIKYTVVEDETGLKEIGYTTTIKDTTITNSRTPELVNIPISKTWIDNSNSEGYRPSKVTINLLANNTKVDSVELTGDGNTWSYTFKDKPKYQNGQEIEYSVEEVNVDSHYEASYPEDDKRTVVNTVKDLSRDIEITKKWIDNNNQDGKRPEKITVNLVGMVEKEKVVEKSLEITGEVTEDTWTNKFMDLPIFYKGKLISYSINEEDVTDYPTTSITGDVKEGFTIENTHETEKISIDATKVWTDGDDQDGLRPEEITINLLENNEFKESKTIKASNNWKVTFENLDKYKDGKEISYSIEEENVPEGYESEIDQKTRTITNTHKPEEISYHITKIWEDFDNQDGVRPEKITVRLYANDIEVDHVTISEKDNWEYSFEKLPKYKAGKLIKYTITEDNVDLYETDEITTVENTKEVKEIDNTITNNHELIPYNETGEITVTKTWDDDNNKYNSRPENITVHLFADDKEIDSAILSKENNWTYTFKDLLKYKEGEVGVEIKYTITEDKVDKYETTINGFNITNKYSKPIKPKKTTTPPKLEIIPPKTGVTTDNNNKSLFELLTALITLSYTLVISKKLNLAK